jgi:hypothetical protein
MHMCRYGGQVAKKNGENQRFRELVDIREREREGILGTILHNDEREYDVIVQWLYAGCTERGTHGRWSRI